MPDEISTILTRNQNVRDSITQLLNSGNLDSQSALKWTQIRSELACTATALTNVQTALQEVEDRLESYGVTISSGNFFYDRDFNFISNAPILILSAVERMGIDY